MSLPALLGQSPDAAVIVCVAGISLIYIEFNRPGMILPGAAGLLLLLLGVAGLSRYPADPVAIVCLLASAGILAWGVRRKTTWFVGAAATVGIFIGCRSLIRVADGPQIHLLTAGAAALLLGPGTFLLTAIARRARVNKGLD